MSYLNSITLVGFVGSDPVLRQNLIRVENGFIPRWNDLNMTRELNRKPP